MTTPAKRITKDSPEYAAAYAKMKAQEAATEFRLNAPWRYYEQTHPNLKDAKGSLAHHPFI